MNDFILILITIFSVAIPLLYFAKDGKARLGILVVSIGGILAILFLSVLYSEDVNASELTWFESTTIFLGLDTDINNKVFCYSGSKVNDTLTSNAGLRQNLFKYGNASVSAQYTHHSCALNTDKPTYDAIGLQLEWTLKR